jgi:hypothetical protein
MNIIHKASRALHEQKERISERKQKHVTNTKNKNIAPLYSKGQYSGKLIVSF